MAVCMPCRAADVAIDPRHEISLSADYLQTWDERGVHFLLLRGRCIVEQGPFRLQTEECLLWTRGARNVGGDTISLGVLAKGNVAVSGPEVKQPKVSEFSSILETTAGYVPRVGQELQRSPATDHRLYKWALETQQPFGDGEVARADFNGAAGDGVVRQVQQSEPASPGAGGGRRRAGGQASGIGMPKMNGGPSRRRISFVPRTSKEIQTESVETSNGERLTSINGGVVATIEELDTGNVATVAADRMVVWTRGIGFDEVRGRTTETPAEQRIELYLEGNVQIVFGNDKALSKGQQVQLSGKQVYFDVNRNRALVLDGVIETYDDRFKVPVVMRAERLFMLTQDKFYAEKSAFTTSPYRGQPGYDVGGQETYLEQVKQEIRNPFTGSAVLDANGQPLTRTRNFGTGYSNVFHVQGIPVLYLPYLRADLEHPLGPVETIRFGNSSTLGTSISVTLNMWRLLGLDYLNIADRADWVLDTGYYSRRGPSIGTRLNYHSEEPIGQPGAYYGRMLTWWIWDHGTDNLGSGREDLPPPDESRGRFLFQHRQEFANDLTLIAGVSYLSDKNFLESYFQNEYVAGPNQETFLYLKQARDQWAWTALVQPRINEFLPQTEALPRADGYIIGKSLWEDRLTYFSHSSIGYFRVRPPEDMPALNSPTWDTVADTGRIDTRHELDLPIPVGDLTVVPYAVGEFTGYSQAVNGDSLGRFYGAGGVRASLPLWRVYSGVESSLFNLHGLAHKITFDADYQYGYSNRSAAELPYIDTVDDNTSDLVRRQNLFRQYVSVGLPIPARYDPRYEALRRGIDLPEVVDDMQTLRLGVGQRLQTKRGPVGAEKIIDWMTLDLHATYFPQADRDNMGKPFGLFDYNYRWHVGDRTSILSSALYDPIDDTVTANAGVFIQRPPRSTLYVFYSHYTSGPFQSNFIGFNTSYRLSYKYAGFAAMTVDLTRFDQVSYQLGFTRIGLDFIMHGSIVLNAGRKDLGFQFELVPRIQPRSSYNRGLLETLPYGVEPGDQSGPLPVADRIGIMQPTTGGATPF